VSDSLSACPRDKVNRQVQAPRPNALWVSDFTYVATWQGFVYVAFVIDAFARRNERAKPGHASKTFLSAQGTCLSGSAHAWIAGIA
jgi:transposase InsO family protein